MYNHFRKTKIVSTLGPATTGKIWDFAMAKDPKNKPIIEASKAKLEGIFLAGTTTCRFNFSHGGKEEQQLRVNMVREVSKKIGMPISLLLDTKGPECRVGDFEGGEAVVEKSSIVKIYSKKSVLGNPNQFSVTDSTGKYNMAKDVKVGGMILVDDGKLFLKITKIDVAGGTITCKAENSHKLVKNKRINLPGASYSMQFMSAKDKADLALACELGFDYVAPSFVNTVAEVKQVREVLKANGGSKIKIISKIESVDGIKNLDGIIEASDGVMVARGDLGIDFPYEQVPFYERYMAERCRKLGKICIVATQMLDSMERNLLPTRAEVTDCWYAVEIGADSTMTSGETAAGNNPVESIQAMNKINTTSELYYNYSKALEEMKQIARFSSAAKNIAEAISSKLLPSESHQFPHEFCFLFTNDKEVIEAVSASRPGAAIIACVSDAKLYTNYGVEYGIKTFKVKSVKPTPVSAKATIKEALKIYTPFTSNKKVLVAVVDGKTVKTSVVSK